MRPTTADQRPCSIAGRAGGTAAGGGGNGYTWVKLTGAAGYYEVRLDRDFRGPPAVAIAAESSGSFYANVWPLDSRRFEIRTWNGAGALADCGFSFTAQGVLR
jgi:hypothetical protein